MTRSLLYVFSIALCSALHSHIWQNIKNAPAAVNPVNCREDSHERFFCDQKVNHFSEEISTWCQRYFVNSDHFDLSKEKPLIFVCVGGEGPPISGAFVTESNACNDMVTLAKDVGALILALEHRYYGPAANCPTPKNVTASLLSDLFTSRQALADLAEFHSYASYKYAGREAVWVSFGSSYPGMLSSWARLLYPLKFIASVASSAPVEASLEFPEYNAVVGAAFSDPLVGGSVECASQIHLAHEKVGQALLGSSEARRKLESLFNVCPLPDGSPALDSKRNWQVWASGGLLGGFSVQSNDPSCEGDYCNIQNICALMTDPSTLLSEPEKLALIAKASRGSECMDVNFQSYIEQLRDPNRRSWDTMWLFQTCNEFGFYQTCPPKEKNCLWIRETIPDLDNLEFSMIPCREAFGIDDKQVEENIQKTNSFYGGRLPKSSRVLFPNGGIDPWHARSLLVAPHPDLPTLWVPSASHHFWTHLPRKGDFSDILRSREAIHRYVKKWVGERGRNEVAVPEDVEHVVP